MRIEDNVAYLQLLANRSIDGQIRPVIQVGKNIFFRNELQRVFSSQSTFLVKIYFCK